MLSVLRGFGSDKFVFLFRLPHSMTCPDETKLFERSTPNYPWAQSSE